MKWLLWGVGGTVGVILFIIILFIMQMAPNDSRVAEAEQVGQRYIDEHFKDRAEVYDMLYDNMGNFEFEYAAKVRLYKRYRLYGL